MKWYIAYTGDNIYPVRLSAWFGSIAEGDFNKDYIIQDFDTKALLLRYIVMVTNDSRSWSFRIRNLIKEQL